MVEGLPTLRALAASPPQAAGYLIDLDGTLVSGSRILPGAIEFLDRLPGPYVIVSNDSEHVGSDVSRLFARHGVWMDSARIVLAGVAAVESIAARSPGAGVMLLGSAQLAAYAMERGLVLDSRQADIVLVARDRGFTFDKLAAAARAVHFGARVVVACPDYSHPGHDGEPIPEAGALAAALLACAGQQSYEVIGKPEAMLFTLGCQRLGIPASRCVMIGDNPLTDGVGARRAGVEFCQVAAVGVESPAD
ncbi:MAG: HAD family hydrolase [Devosia sp.]